MNAASRIRAIFIKELTQLKRDRMTFGMIVLIPLLELLLFGYAINTNVRQIPVGILDYSQTTLSRNMQQTVAATQVVEFTHRFMDLENAQLALATGKVRAVLVLPADIGQRWVRRPGLNTATQANSRNENGRPLAQWLVDGSDTMIASAVKSLRNMPFSEIGVKSTLQTAPTFEITMLYNPEQRTVVNIVPGLVAIILTMTMIMFTSAAIVRESERGNMEMLITTPVRPIELMLGKIIPYIFIGAIQVSIILIVGHLLLDVPFNGSLLQLIIATFLFITASLTLGLVISTLASNQLQAMQMTVFVFMPSILLSGFMFPYEGMPVPAQYIAEALPATHFMRMVRGIILRDALVIDMFRDALWLTLFTVGGLVVASLRFRKRLD
jgi:ABC-2 type transport system permease protein